MKHSLMVLEVIEKRIFLMRGQKVMLDVHLAELYGVETKALKRAVRRNKDRFPDDFIFQMTKEEYDSLRYHFGTLKRGEHAKYLPYAFTEHGAIMVASVLNSPKAIEASVYVVRAFVRLRNLLASHKELALKLNELEQRIASHDGDIQAIVKAIRQLMQVPEKPKRRIGFRVGEPRVAYKIRRKL